MTVAAGFMTGMTMGRAALRIMHVTAGAMTGSIQVWEGAAVMTGVTIQRGMTH